MERFRSFGLVLLLASLCVMTFFGGRYLVQWFTIATAPVLQCETELSFPPAKIGTPVEVSFELANIGGKPLEISKIHSSCGCTGVIRRKDGQESTVSQLSIPPGESIPLYLRYTARGKPGGTQISEVSFETNDPTQPSATIQLQHPLQGTLTGPKAIEFNQVRNDLVHRQRFFLSTRFCEADELLESIHSTHPGLLSTSIVSRNDKEREIEVEATFTPGGQALNMEAKLSCHLAGMKEPTLIIPVRLEALPSVQVTPSSVVLPSTARGANAYTTEVVCRSTQMRPFAARVRHCDEGVTVHVFPNESNHDCRVEIRGQPEVLQRLSQGKVLKRLVQLTFEVDKKAVEAELRVLYIPQTTPSEPAP